MDISSFIRDAQAVKKSLATLPDQRVITKTGGEIHIPTRFVDKGLATVGVTNSTIGIFAFILPDKRYSVMKVPSRLKIEPTSTGRVMVDNVDYTVFRFDPGSCVFKSTACVKEDTLVYYVFDELFMKGNIPWFIDYNDMGKMFNTAKKYAGTGVASNRVAIEMITSHLSRTPEDKTKFYRHSISNMMDVKKKRPVFISLGDVSYAPTSTMYKLAGSYMDEGLVSAFNNPGTQMDRVEAIVRA